MFEKDLVSIIMPSYNSKNYIFEAIDSVNKQTYRNFELIIVDDCSKDGTFELLQKFVIEHKFIRLFRLEKNSGTACARNLGLDMAKGEFISFLDSDDMIDNNYLEKQVQFLKANGPIVTSSYRRKAQNSITNFIVPDNITYNLILKGNPLSCLTTMYNRNVIGNIKFDESLLKVEDYVFWLNILKKGFSVKGNKEVLATYRILPNSKSRNKIKLIHTMFFIYHKNQKNNVFTSLYYLMCWGIYGFKKYKNVK